VLKTFNYLTLLNVIKVISNFTANTISGTAITNGTLCASPCYLTYSSMNTPFVLTANSFTYTVNLEGLLTVVVFNPLFTLT